MLEMQDQNSFTRTHRTHTVKMEKFATIESAFLPGYRDPEIQSNDENLICTCNDNSRVIKPTCPMTLHDASNTYGSGAKNRISCRTITQSALIEHTTAPDSESRTDTDEVHSTQLEERDSLHSQYEVEVEILDGSYMQIEVQHSSESDLCNREETTETPIKRFCEADYFLQPLLTRNGSVFDSLLEKNSFMCSGIDDWFVSDESENEQSEIFKTDAPSNRSGFPKYREKRIENLNINLNPFHLDQTVFVKNSLNRDRYSPVEIEKRVHSFSAFHGPTSPNSVADMHSSLTKNLHCRAFPTCGNHHEFNRALMDWDEPDEDDLCYDSDPNEILASSKITRQARKTDCCNIENKPINSNKFRTVSELMGTKLLLVWHRPLPYDQCPAAVHAWIEHGSNMRGGVIQPRLMWQESCGKEHKEGERFVLSRLAFHSIDLLDICKVFSAKVIDRSLYPLAKKSCCLMVRTSNREFLFEAENIRERDNFVESLKMLVARLASLIIVGDRNILKEFFNSDSLHVPGKVPDILSDIQDEISLDDSYIY
jgi:hypothetical protein